MFAFFRCFRYSNSLLYYLLGERMRHTLIRNRALATGLIVSLITSCVGVVNGETTKALPRHTLHELIQRIQRIDLSDEDRHLLGKELEDRVPTTIAEVKALFSLVGKKRGHVRQIAINAISNTIDPALNPVFLQGLNDKNPIINAISASMCGKLRIRKASDGLVMLIKRMGPVEGVVENDRERAAIAAVLALGEIKDESKIPFLIGLSSKMRGYEVIALIKYGKKAVPGMLRKITSTDQEYIRQQAERVLLSIQDLEAIPLLKEEMEDPNSPSRSICIRVLLNIDAERTLSRLLQLWEKENDPIIASLMLDHLDHYQITDSRYGPFAERILRNSVNNNLRKKASAILGRIGGESARKTLQKALKDEDPLVRAFAARSLGYLEFHSTPSPKK